MMYLLKMKRYLSSCRLNGGRELWLPRLASLFVCRPGVFLGVRLDRIYVGSFLLAVAVLAAQGFFPGGGAGNHSTEFGLHAVPPYTLGRAFRSASLSMAFWKDEIPIVRSDSPESLLLQLKKYDLWEIEEYAEIQPVVFANFPPQFKELTAESKKRLFLHSLLPVVSVALAEVKQERRKLEEILEKIALKGGGADFSLDSPLWRNSVTEEEALYLENLAGKYRTADTRELLDRVNVLPLSLILAQGAIESYWGTSRFAQEGNNLFGMWTWGEQGLIPAQREAGKDHKLVSYDSILESVQDFILTLNRLSPYADLRKIRRETMDPLALANGLFHYSERGDGYIRDVKTVIEYNDLQKFDGIVLKEPARQERFALVAAFFGLRDLKSQKAAS